MPLRQTDSRRDQPRLYRQAATPACSTFTLKPWLALGSKAGTSCVWVATTFPFASRKSNVILRGADGLGRKFVICPSSVAPFSVGVKLDTVISTGSESVIVRLYRTESFWPFSCHPPANLA